MSTNRKDGGAAFPQMSRDPWAKTSNMGGMSLRDYAVIQYTAAMLAHSTRYRPRVQDEGMHWHAAITKEAGELADAMLAEREQYQTEPET